MASRKSNHQYAPHGNVRTRSRRSARPVAAYRRRGDASRSSAAFNAPEVWHDAPEKALHELRIVRRPAGKGYRHAVTADEVRARLALLPAEVHREVAVVQFSPMTRKRQLFPCYGMQWGSSVYLYPIEESLIEIYHREPGPQFQIETRMYGGSWVQRNGVWELHWTEETIRDFYLNNVLIHEVGHVVDDRNKNFDRREQYANWFAIEYGYRVSRGRR